MTHPSPRPSPRGVGLGFRFELADALFALPPDALPWVEIHPENYVGRGGVFAAHLERALERWPVVTHGLSLGLGATEPFDPAYVRALRDLLRRVGARWHSEHLCFSSVGGAHLHDLLPLPFTPEAAALAARRARELSDALEVELAIENVSFYAHPGGRAASHDEASFLLDVLDRSGAKLLLDVNNVLVNAKNHGFDARAFLDRMPHERVVQVHVAGHLVRPDGRRLDTHGEPVPDEVFALLAHLGPRVAHAPWLLERDQSFPPLSALLDEVQALEALRAEHAPA